MTGTHDIKLEPYKGPASRHTCPSCQEKKKLSLYIYTATGAYLSDIVGRCDREDSCGYHYTPKQFFADNPKIESTAYRVQCAHGTNSTTNTQSTHGTQQNTPVDYLPFDIMNSSVSKHQLCNLYPFLDKLFRETLASSLCENYFIGTNKEGNTAFWQVDIFGRVRYVKIMPYKNDGHRDKNKVLKSWIDKETGQTHEITGAYAAGKEILKNSKANLQQCFFGEYLLSLDENKDKPVGIVESEKTAVIAAVYYPGFVWLATGGKHGARWTEANVCKVLNKRKVILFPDLGAFEAWKDKGLLLAAVAGCTVAVSDSLEQIATDEDRAAGLDIADYLLRNEDSSGLAMTENFYPAMWDHVDLNSSSS